MGASYTKNESYTIVSCGGVSLPEIPVTTLHLSCASHVYRDHSKNYAGFVLYSHNDQTSWMLNRRKCKSGYIVIQDTDSFGVRRYLGTSPGVVHGAVYKNVFGEDIGERTVGEGFSVMGGVTKWNSYTFNAHDDYYHDSRKGISQVAQENIEIVLNDWMYFGKKWHCLPTKRNYDVQNRLETYR